MKKKASKRRPGTPSNPPARDPLVSRKPARPAGFRGGLCGDDPCVDCSVLPASLARHANRSDARPPGGMIFLILTSLLLCAQRPNECNNVGLRRSSARPEQPEL